MAEAAHYAGKQAQAEKGFRPGGVHGKKTDERGGRMEQENKSVSLTYRLGKDDILLCLKSGRVFRTGGARAWVQTGLLAVLGAGFFASWLLYEEHDASNLVLAIVCVAVIVAVWLVPFFGMRARAKQAENEKEVTAVVTPEEISLGSGDSGWKIALDKTSCSWQAGGLLIVETPYGRMTALPLGGLPEEEKSFVLRCVEEGTAEGPPRRGRKHGRL